MIKAAVTRSSSAATVDSTSPILTVEEASTLAVFEGVGLTDLYDDEEIVIEAGGEYISAEADAPELLDVGWTTTRSLYSGNVQVTGLTSGACGVSWQIRADGRLGTVTYTLSPSPTSEQTTPHLGAASIYNATDLRLTYSLWWRLYIGGSAVGDYTEISGVSITFPDVDGPPMEG